MPISLVTGQKGGASGGGTTVSATFPGTTTSGNLLIATVHQATNAPTLSISTDTYGNTWHSAGSIAWSSAAKLQVFYAYNCIGGATHSVTGQSSANYTIQLRISEWSGAVSGSDPIDQFASGSGFNQLTTSNTSTLSQADELVYGAIGTSASTTNATSPGTPTILGESETAETCADEYFTVSSTTGVQASFTLSTSDTNGVAVATFKALLPGVDQEGYRFRNDDGSETTATWAASQDTDLTAVLGTRRLRTILNVTSGDPATATYRLDYRKSTDTQYLPVSPAPTPAIPTFQNSNSNSGTAAVTLAWPGSYLVGDIALLFVESCGGEPASLSVAAGFAAVTNSPQATGAGTAGTQLTAFWCRATSLAMGQITVADPGDHCFVAMLNFRGCVEAGNPIHITAGGVKAAAGTTTTFDSVTTTVDNCLIVNVATRDNDSAAAAWSAWANASLSGVTERFDSGTTSGNGGGVGVGTGGLATHGASGATTATVTSSVDGHMTIALLPQNPAIVLQPSSNIGAGGTDATTAQLTSPAGKTTGDFQAGAISDDTDPLPTLDLASGKYTELEFCVATAGPATTGDTYQFRIGSGSYQAGAVLSSYSVTPQWIIGSGGGSVFNPYFYSRLAGGYV